MNKTNSLDEPVYEFTDTDLPYEKPRPVTEEEKQKRREARRKMGWPEGPRLPQSPEGPIAK